MEGTVKLPFIYRLQEEKNQEKQATDLAYELFSTTNHVPDDVHGNGGHYYYRHYDFKDENSREGEEVTAIHVTVRDDANIIEEKVIRKKFKREKKNEERCVEEKDVYVAVYRLCEPKENKKKREFSEEKPEGVEERERKRRKTEKVEMTMGEESENQAARRSQRRK